MSLSNRIAKLYLAKGAPFSICMGQGCNRPPEIECIWAEGRGRAWHCQKCHDVWIKENEDTEGEEDWLSVAIVKQRKVHNGVVGEKYGEYPQKTAKEHKTWDSVGLFIPLPAKLARNFPSLGEEDTSPPHITFLYIGEVAPEDEQKLLDALKEVHGKWWPKVTATLGDLAHFDHPDKDRRVAHVQVEFDKDLSGMRHRVKQELTRAGFDVQDSFPEYKPHVTLQYMDGIDHPDYEGEVPEGSWTFKGLEVWGLPSKRRIKFGPSFYKVSEKWLADQVLQSRVAQGWLAKQGSPHVRSIALMKWLSQAAKKLGVGRDTYVVGGAVRNFVINQPIKDIDIVIDSVAAGHDSDWLAENLKRLIPVPSNVTTNQYGVAILTIKGPWDLDGQDMQGEVIEIANARKESYGGESGKGYKPSEVVPATIQEDLARREFSFNTLLWRLEDLASGPEKAEILDLTGCGMRDLQNGILACPLDPDKTFSDDPTRILRAIKFTGKYGFKIPPDLAAAIKRNAPKMKRMPWEAIGNILVDNILKEPTARKSLQQMKDLGILDVVSEMIQEKKPFATFMAGQLKSNRRIQLLLDLMELGVPASTPIGFLDAQGQRRLRELTVRMPREWAEKFVEHLIKPPVDNRRVIQDLNLPNADRRFIQPTARNLILVDPRLAESPSKLTNQVLRVLQTRQANTSRLASMRKTALKKEDGPNLYQKIRTDLPGHILLVKMLQDAVATGHAHPSLGKEYVFQRAMAYKDADKALASPRYKAQSKQIASYLSLLAQWVLRFKSIPKGQAKALERAAKPFIGAKQAPRKIALWWNTNEKYAQYLMDAYLRWKDKPTEGSESSLEVYPIAGFTIHNTLQLEGEDLVKTNKVIEAASKFVKSSGIPGAAKVLYGDIFVVGKLRGHNTLAWYYITDDNIYLRPLLKADLDATYSLAHELGHRYWYKVMSREERSQWSRYHQGQAFNRPEVMDQIQAVIATIKPGQPMPVPIQGTKQGGPPIVVEIENAHNQRQALVVWEMPRGKKKGMRGKTKLQDIANFVGSQETRKMSFPTGYASTSPEEHFAESFAMYSMRKLTGTHKENFEKLVVNR